MCSFLVGRAWKKGVRCTARAWIAALALAASLGTASWANAQTAPPIWKAGPAIAPAPENQSNFLNLQHTMAVRKAFLQDKELAALNLGVIVQSRVAFLWGPVPSRETLNRALKAVANIPDILEVRNHLYIDESEEVVPQYLPDPNSVKPQPKNTVPPPAKTIVPSNEGKTAIAQQTSSIWHKPAENENVSFKATMTTGGSKAEDQALFVLPTIAIPIAPPPSKPAPQQPAAIKPLSVRLAELQASDKRFHKMQLSIQDTRVYLSGAAFQWADVHQLAKAISQEPGVGNVIIGQVQVSSGK